MADLMIAVYEMGGYDTRKTVNQPEIDGIFAAMAAAGDIQVIYMFNVKPRW